LTDEPYPDQNENVLMYFKSTYTAADDGSFAALEVGVNNMEPEHVITGYELFGKEVFLGQMAYEKLSRTIYYIKGGIGGTGLNPDEHPNWNANALLSDNDCLRISTVHYL